MTNRQKFESWAWAGWKAAKRLLPIFLLMAIPAFAQRTFYIDFAGGSDANSVAQAQVKTTPWKTAPGMSGSTIAGYSCAVGDTYILKGGVVWDQSTVQWTFPCSGNATTDPNGCAGTGCITVTYDPTYFTGGSFTRPIIDHGGWSNGPTNTICFHNNSTTVSLSGQSYINFNGIEFRGQCNQTGSTGGRNAYINVANGSGSDHITISNNYFHEGGQFNPASCYSGHTCGDTWGAVVINVATHAKVTQNYLDGTDGGDGSGNYAGSGITCTNGTCLIEVSYNVFINMPQCMDSREFSYHDNYENTCAASSVDGSGSIHAHIMNSACCTGGQAYWYNNVTDSAPTGQGMEPGTSATAHIFMFNNVGTNLNTVHRQLNFTPPSGTVSAFFSVFNNTWECGLDATPPAGTCGAWDDSGTNTATFEAYNIHTISTSLAMTGNALASFTDSAGTFAPSTFSVSYPGSPADMITQSKATANAQGYSYGQTYQFSPTSGAGATVGAGVNKTALCNTITDAAAKAACKQDTTYAVSPNATTHTAVASGRTPVLRPSSGPWDVGAFQFPTNTPTPAPAPMFAFDVVPLPSTAVTQPTITSVSPGKTYVTKNGCSQDGKKWVNPCTFRVFCNSCDQNTMLSLDGAQVTQIYLSNEMDATVPLSLLPVPSQVTVHNFSAVNPAPLIPVLQ